MNVFDIISIAIFALFVVICTARGFLKILAKWGAFFAAMILSRMFGPRVGEMLFGEISFVSSFSFVIGTTLLFTALFFVFRIILRAVAKLITKALNATVLDRILGAVVGIVGGLAAVFLLTFVCDLLISLVSFFNSNANIIHMIDDSLILNFFMM